MVAWLIRGVLAVGLVLLVILEVGGRTLTSEVSPSSSPTMESTDTPRPTLRATLEPVVERVTSRISRETPVPIPTSTPRPDAATRVSVVDFGFMPSVLRIRQGQTVIWRNDGSEEHDITGDDWHSGAMEPTIEYRLTLGYVGSFTYRCSIHPDMSGTVVVAP